MLRAILKREDYCVHQDRRSTAHFTLDFDCPELESILTAGGWGPETGFDQTHLIGVEIIPKKEGLL